ncbi:MAG: hypothetical protein EB127_25295, partial [Alphaproteobacteria bacterium]|nr:hypothetical protein [Alphaproteobacteria bacterium]
MDVTQYFHELKRLIHEKSGEIESFSRSGGGGAAYEQKLAEDEKARLESELRSLVEQHPELETPVSFVPPTTLPLTQSRPRKTVQMTRKKTVTTVAPVPEVAVATVPEVALPCDILYDPCTGKPLEENTIKALEKRIREIRNMSSENPEVEQFPDTIKTRLDLLIDLLNKPEAPSNKLFKYTINGQLYEAYWDIVFTLNLIDEFQRTDDFYMITKKAELLRPDELEAYVNNPIEYISADSIVDRPLCKCGNPSEVRLSKDKTKIYFECSLKNMIKYMIKSPFKFLQSPCNFWQLYTEDTHVKTQYEVVRARSRESWVLNIPLSAYKIEPEPCISCKKTGYLAIFNSGTRRLCQPCIITKYNDLKEEYEDKCLIKL